LYTFLFTPPPAPAIYTLSLHDALPIYIGESLHHDPLQATIDVVFIPEQLLKVLNPFEVRDCDTTGVGEDVGDHHDSALVEYRVRSEERRVGKEGRDGGAEGRDA